MKIIDKQLTDSFTLFVFEAPASKRVIKYKYKDCHQFYLSMPRMRFFAHVDRYRSSRKITIRTLTVNFIGSDNSAYPAILPNINQLGDVCMGDINFDRGALQDDDKLINEIYSSFISTSFTLHGAMLVQFLYFNRWVKEDEQNVSVYDDAIIKFFSNWQEKGLEFQNLFFRDKIKKTCLNAYKERMAFFQTHMSLG